HLLRYIEREHLLYMGGEANRPFTASWPHLQDGSIRREETRSVELEVQFSRIDRRLIPEMFIATPAVLFLPCLAVGVPILGVSILSHASLFRWNTPLQAAKSR